MKFVSLVVLLLGLVAFSSAFQPQAQPQPAGGSVECSLCEFVVSSAERYITNSTNEKDIERVLNHVCDVLPKQVESFCEDFVSQYTPILIQYIKAQYPAEVVCEKIGLCDAKKVVEVIPEPQEALKPSKTGCAICEYIVNIAENYISDQKTEKELEEVLNKICTFVPDQYQATCNAAVALYGPKIIEKILARDLAALDKLCDTIGVCAAEQQTPAESEVTGDTGCAVCEYLLSYLENMVDSHTTVEQVEKVCTILPSSVQKPCLQIVDTYGPQILDYLVNKYPADKVCGLIHLCKAASEEPPKTMAPTGFYCTACEFVMSHLDDFLGKDTTIQEILDFLNNDVCAKLPNEIESVCHLFVNMEADKVIRAIIQDISPDRVCSYIKACDRE